ncbi:MAG: hypothetical protein H0U61_07835 [Nocardioidaceae bacterium]|nr:hypothetical protein [Nocardioidaceae bacterium]
MGSCTRFEMGEYSDALPRIEEEFQHALDESLTPRGPGLLSVPPLASGLLRGVV